MATVYNAQLYYLRHHKTEEQVEQPPDTLLASQDNHSVSYLDIEARYTYSCYHLRIYVHMRISCKPGCRARFLANGLAIFLRYEKPPGSM